MNVDLVTCTDWQYRHWATTLFKTLDKSWRRKYIIAVGPGDWDSYGMRIGANIINQQFAPGLDKVLYCQNVRMKHLYDLLQNCDYLLQIDADFRQNLPFNIYDFHKHSDTHQFWCKRKKGKIKERYQPKPTQVIWQNTDPRFHLNAGWCLYKNTEQNLKILSEIQNEFNTNYDNTKNWDQLQLYKHYKSTGGSLVFKYIDEGVKKNYHATKGGFRTTSAWWHCKGLKKEYEKYWHSV